VLDNTVIATVRVSDADRANVLSTNGTPNSRYPRSGTIAIDRDSRGNPITVSIDELRAIQSGAALALVVTQVSANVIRWDRSTQNWDASIAWTSFENQIDPVTMTVQADLGDGRIHEYEIYAGSAYNEPDYTLRDILARVFAVEERGDGTYVAGRKYPGEWYLSSPSPAVVEDWEAAGKPSSMLGVRMRPTTRVILQSTSSTQGPHIGFATFSSDMRHVFVSAEPHVYPIFEATATVYVNGQPRELTLERIEDFPFLTNRVPLEAPASPEAVVRIVDAVDNVSTASIVPGALRRDCVDVLAELDADESIEYGRRYLVFENGDPNVPIDVYCNHHGEIETLHYFMPGKPTDRAFYEADFINDSTGVIVGQDRWLSVTEDGIRSSQLFENHGIPGSIHDAHMVSRDTIRAIGAGGVFAWTNDGGATWEHQTVGTTQTMFGLDFLNRDFGIASGGGGEISVTHDGGATWALRNSRTGFTLFDVHVVDSTFAVAVGDAARVTISHDGGETWLSQVPAPLEGSRIQLHAVSFLNPSVGLAVGDSGTIVRTTDGGQTWTRVPSATSQHLWDVQFVSEEIAMAVGLTGTVLRSEDTGETWSPISGYPYVFTSTNYIGLHFLDENHGVIVGHGGIAVMTGSGFGHPSQTFTVDVEDAPEVELPDRIALDQNYPNPFNPATTIAYRLTEPSNVRLAVYDVLGRQVALLVDGPVSPGTHEVHFDAASLASGTYLYQLRAGSEVETRKMVLVR
ncbi:MAG TPA: YCF48-related protein, partial [Rhodothermales bacterium]